MIGGYKHAHRFFYVKSEKRGEGGTASDYIKQFSDTDPIKYIVGENIVSISF
jgi:hypothetical protein